MHRKVSRTDASAEWKSMLLAPSELNDGCRIRAEKDLSVSCRCTQLASSLHLPWSPALNEEYCKLERQYNCNQGTQKDRHANMCEHAGIEGGTK